MADERIVVEWIATQQAMLTAFDKMNKKLDDQDAKLSKIGQTSKKTANLAAGSFAALEKELRDNEKALKGMERGTAEFAAQKRKVDALRNSMAEAKGELGQLSAANAGASQVVSKFTTAITGTVMSLVSAGAIAASLKSDLAAIKQVRENARLAEVDFGQAMAARTISNLAENEREAVKPLALNLADELGLKPGGIVEGLGTLRSSGAESIGEAAEFLRQAAQAFPQDLASAVAISQAGLIEARATGNRDPRQVIGGIVASQAVSQTTSPEAFAKAFSANTAAAVNILKISAERAREEAAIFSIFEPRSAEVAATSQKSFFNRIQGFVPQESVKLDSGGTADVAEEIRTAFVTSNFSQRQQMLEQNESLRKQFIQGLPEEGRNAIIRRIAPSDEDKKTIALVQSSIQGDKESAALLKRQQDQAQTFAAMAIASGRREAQVETKQIRSDEITKLTAELSQTVEAVEEQRRARFGGAATGWLEDLGFYVEKIASGAEDVDMLRGRLEYLATADRETPEAREFAQQQLNRLSMLEAQLNLLRESNERGNDILQRMLNQGPVNKPGVRPQEAPLPATTLAD